MPNSKTIFYKTKKMKNLFYNLSSYNKLNVFVLPFYFICLE